MQPVLRAVFDAVFYPILSGIFDPVFGSCSERCLGLFFCHDFRLVLDAYSGKIQDAVSCEFSSLIGCVKNGADLETISKGKSFVSALGADCKSIVMD